MSIPIEPSSGQPLAVAAIDKDQRTWATLAHLSGFLYPVTALGHIAGPLVIWLVKRDGQPFVEDQAREALNFQISTSIYAIGAFVLCFLIIGIPILFGLMAFHFICMIIAAIKANEGIAFRYPLNLRLIK